jgi:hypothetical protein
MIKVKRWEDVIYGDNMTHGAAIKQLLFELFVPLSIDGIMNC